MGASLGRTRLLLGWLLVVVGNAALTAALLPLDRGPGPSYEAMLFLALVVLTALVGGLWPALACSLVGVLALNYWFVEPVHTLHVDSGVNVVMLVVFAAVSVGVSSVVDSAARRREQAIEARAEADVLAGLNRTLLAGSYDVDGLLRLVRTTFGAEAAELLPDDSLVAFGDTVADASAHTILVLRGVSLEPRERRVLDAFATHLGVLREREELALQTAAARELEAGNGTRTALLAAVSHDLRTPLAALRAAVGTLRRHDANLSAADRTELLGAVETSATRLSRMVADLLDMSRLQTGAVSAVLAPTPAQAVVDGIIQDLAGGERVRVVPPLPNVVADPGLLERVLANLVGNAVLHTDGPVEVSGSVEGTRARISVVDHGPGVPADRRTAMFEPFQRSDDASGDGVGLGLAVARGLVEAQGGDLMLEETPGGGLTMVVALAGPDEQ